jgi:uncharacterized protein YdaU (DUF1376 family)
MTRRASFQFYPDDFLSGTTTMSRAAVGGYISMLCVSWGQGPIPNTAAALTKALSLGPGDPPLNQIWAEVRPKWKRGKRGWTNVRLEHVRTALDHYLTLQREKGRRGGQARQAGAQAAAQAVAQAEGVAEFKPPNPNPKKIKIKDQDQCADARFSHKVLVRLAHDVFSEIQGAPPPTSELLAQLKDKAARARIAYDSRVAAKALESAEVQWKVSRG